MHLQGCTLACPACFNPASHDPQGGELRDVDELAGELARGEPDGVSVSGGEPFQQPEALLALVRALRARRVVSILVFSGYALEELERRPGAPEILAEIDVLIAGRYDPELATADPLLASANQRLHLLTTTHSPAEFVSEHGNVELTISPDGTVTLTGFPSPTLRRIVRKLGE